MNVEYKYFPSINPHIPFSKLLKGVQFNFMTFNFLIVDFYPNFHVTDMYFKTQSF